MRKIGLVLIFIGLAVFIYFGYDWWTQRQAVQDMSQEELNDYLGYDETYQESLDVKNEGENYSFSEGDSIGELQIPSIEYKYPVFFGTDPDTLKSGVGMYNSKWTVLPNQNGHVFVSGHRDTVFEEMGELDIGDIVSIDFKDDTYVYQIRKIFVTHKDDRTVIVEKDHSTLTISTCYPFEFIGNAPYRYIIQSDLIDIK